MYFWLFIGVFILYSLWNAWKKANYWKDRGVTHIKAWPFLGTSPSNLLQRIPFTDQINNLYKKFPNAKYIGIHQFTNPILVIRDPELIKKITVKDFDSFMNRRFILGDESELLFNKSLLSLKGEKWKNMRSVLSPAFTSSKMRLLFTLMTECAEQFVVYFEKEAKKNNEMIITEMKDVFTRYANDVIATAAFGIKCDSLQEKENEFYITGQKITDFGMKFFFKAIGFICFPTLMKLLGIQFSDPKVANFLRKSILTTIKTREENGIIRPDMIHLLMEAKKGNLKHDANEKSSSVQDNSNEKNTKEVLTDDDIVAQAFIFFFAGYDTGSTLMSFMAYELALNSDIQNKLYDEIVSTFQGKKIDYETILKMEYLDMVVSESLRKWPPALIMERICNKPCMMDNPNENEEPFLIEKDIPIWIISYGLHNNPEYFPEPERFDPERFNDENKNKIQPFTYIPFGTGPRNCIGSRFALLEIKVLFVHLLSKFELVVVEKTQIPVKISRKHFNLKTEQGIWLGFKLRN